MSEATPEPALTTATPVLPVREMAAATAFYQDRLGFEILYADDAHGMLRRDGVEIHLWAATDESWRDRPDRPLESGPLESGPLESGAESFLAGTASARIQVSGIEPLHAEMTASKVIHPNGDLSDTPHGTREFTVLDLDGNALAFFQSVS